VLGNYIGTDVTGTLPLGNGKDGVSISIWGNNAIGGAEAGAGNLISGNKGSGVAISGSIFAGQNQVLGNYIGTDASGALPLGNGGDGVSISGSKGLTTSQIGLTTPGAGNTIAFNGGSGVRVDQATGNAIRGNALFANTLLGIELTNGGNNHQPAPTLSAAVVSAADRTLTIQGTLTSTPNTTFALDFFDNFQLDPSGFGEGETFLGSAEVTTDADGHASFSVTLPVRMNAFSFLTATATGPVSGTSDFSPGRLVVSVPGPGPPLTPAVPAPPPLAGGAATPGGSDEGIPLLPPDLLTDLSPSDTVPGPALNDSPQASGGPSDLADNTGLLDPPPVDDPLLNGEDGDEVAQALGDLAEEDLGALDAYFGEFPPPDAELLGQPW
jgi:hypothetical protein